MQWAFMQQKERIVADFDKKMLTGEWGGHLGALEDGVGEKAGDKVLALALSDQVDVFDLIVASLKQVHRIYQRLPFK